MYAQHVHNNTQQKYKDCFEYIKHICVRSDNEGLNGDQCSQQRSGNDEPSHQKRILWILQNESVLLKWFAPFEKINLNKNVNKLFGECSCEPDSFYSDVFEAFLRICI